MQFRFVRSARTLVFVAGLMVLVLAFNACSSGDRAGLSADGVWARAAKMAAMNDAMGGDSMAGDMAGMGHGGANSAIYMTLKNGADAADRLVSAQADVATTIEIHETVMNGDVMQMQQLTNGLEIPAKGQVELKPGGYHVMLIGLTRDLNEGEKFPVTLTFASGATLELEAEVKQP